MDVNDFEGRRHKSQDHPEIVDKTEQVDLDNYSDNSDSEPLSRNARRRLRQESQESADGVSERVNTSKTSTVTLDRPDDEDYKNSSSKKTSDQTQKRTRNKKKKGGFGSWIKELVIILVVALVLSFVVKTFFFRPFYIPSGSMENTLQKEDRVFVNLMVPRNFELQRGDVVVFEDKQGWLAPQPHNSNWLHEAMVFVGLAPDDSSQHLIKRVIGMPGDHVKCCSADGKMSVNGKELNEPYLFPGSENMDKKFDVTVPYGHLWVMGDHRNASADSRMHQNTSGKGFVPIDDVTGKADLIVWPMSRWQAISNQQDTFKDVPSAGK